MALVSDEKFQSYLRLLKYAWPYKGRLLVGLLSGLVVGGSLLGSFMMLPSLIKGVEENAGRLDRKTEMKVEALVQAFDKGGFASEGDKAEAVRSILSPEKDKEKDKLAEEVAKFREKAAKYNIHIPVELRDGVIFFDHQWLSFSLPAQDKAGRMTWQFFSVFVVGFVILWAMKNFFTYINKYMMRWVGTRVIADLRNEIFNKLLGQSLKFYGRMDTGQLISRCTNDTAAIESSVANTIGDITRCPLEIMACAAAIIMASRQHDNYALPLILFLGLPLCVLPIIILGRKIRKIYKQSYSKIADVVSRMHEVFTGIVTVKAYHMENDEVQRFRNTNRKYFRTVVKSLKYELFMAPLMEVVAVAATLVFMVYSYSQQVTLTQLAQLLIPAIIAYQPIKELAKVVTYIQKSMAAADRYFGLIDTDTSIKESPKPVELAEFKDKISFNNVVFSYENGKRILDGISFDMPKGGVVAVVGETGSGKTTIANLIARFYDVDSGSVTVDGVDVRDLKISSLRDLIGIVTQDTILFNDTIANNISYGRKGASIGQITEAAKQANAHQFIVDGRHAEGYDTVVGEKGFKLSGGEKQRVAIARAIMKNPPILILDEATSALDTVTEKLVQEALNRVMENRTVFAIAHRLSTIKHADMIIVLDKGRVAECGTHDELMEKSGRYKKLHDTQFGVKQEQEA